MKLLFVLLMTATLTACACTRDSRPPVIEMMTPVHADVVRSDHGWVVRISEYKGGDDATIIGGSCCLITTRGFIGVEDGE